MHKTKDVYGIQLSKKDAFSFNFFQRNFAHILPSMNTIEAIDRANIVIDWINGQLNNIDDSDTAKEISEKYSTND